MVVFSQGGEGQLHFDAPGSEGEVDCFSVEEEHLQGLVAQAVCVTPALNRGQTVKIFKMLLMSWFFLMCYLPY